MLCPECKHRNPDDNRFCGMCGARLRWSNTETYTPDVAPEPPSPLVTLPEQFAEPSSPGSFEEPPFHEPLRGGYGEYTDALLADLRPAALDDAGDDPAHPEQQLWSDTAAPEEEAQAHPLEAEPLEHPLQGAFEQGRLEQDPLQEEGQEDEHKEYPEPSYAIGGPSFLGLGQAPVGGTGHSYLFEDEPTASGRGWIVAAVFLLMVGAGAVALAQNWHGSRDWAVTRSTLLTERVRNWRSGRPPQPASGQETVTHPNAPSTSQAASSGVANENQEAASGGEQQEQTSGDSSTAEKNGSQQSAEAQANTGPAITVDNGKLDNGNNGNRASDKGQNPEYEAASKAPAEAKPKSETATPKAKAAIAETKPQPSVAAPTEGAAPTAAKQMAVARTTAPAEEDQRGDDLVARGERFLYGQGVRRDCNQAMVYFRAGAEQQNARALSRLGALYATGTCVPMDRVMAYNWFSRALAHDSKNPLLEDNLNMLWRDMSSSERNQVLEPKAHH